MTTEELTVLLARIQVLDNRQVDDLTIQAWEPLVGDLDINDAIEAVNHHFRTSPKYLLPYHVVNGAYMARILRGGFEDRCANGHHYDNGSGYCTRCAQRSTPAGPPITREPDTATIAKAAPT
mgnify:CR=1 FL=1